MQRATHALVFMIVIVLALPSAAKPTPAEARKIPAPLERWSFLVGEWTLDSKRYSLDGPILERNGGRSTFVRTLEGLRLEERQDTELAGRGMLVLNVFAYHPEREEWEIARTDSLHHSFHVVRGTETNGRLVLFERDPRPDADVSRRYTYARDGDDRFTLLLEFSLDGGKTWVRRNETVYMRSH